MVATLTPNSSAVPYATAADFILHYDIRAIADWLSDDGTRVGGVQPNPTTVESNAILAKALLYGSGLVEAACLRSNRYGVDDLTALGGASKELLIGIVCDLALYFLWKRRINRGKMPEQCVSAFEWLQQLANGEMVFAFVQAESAGLPSAYVMQPIDWYEDAFVAQQACRFFGSRADVLNPNQRGSGGCGCGGNNF